MLAGTGYEAVPPSIIVLSHKDVSHCLWTLITLTSARHHLEQQIGCYLYLPSLLLTSLPPPPTLHQHTIVQTGGERTPLEYFKRETYF